jgi:hypothetical protein
MLIVPPVDPDAKSSGVFIEAAAGGYSSCENSECLEGGLAASHLPKIIEND